MQVSVLPSSQLAAAAAETIARRVAAVQRGGGLVRMLAATGASQIELLRELVRRSEVDWAGVELFHLDEYLGLSAEHPASFVRYLRERLIHPAGIKTFHAIDGMADPATTLAALSFEIRKAPIHLALAGIGENGHLAFNDPPADFETNEAYQVVQLDQACRRQQVNEGWFASIDQVPRQAISITIPELLKAEEIVAVVPGRQKAGAVQACLEGPVTPEAPGSALQKHPRVTVYLDNDSGALLREKVS